MFTDDEFNINEALQVTPDEWLVVLFFELPPDTELNAEAFSRAFDDFGLQSSFEDHERGYFSLSLAYTAESEGFAVNACRALVEFYGLSPDAGVAVPFDGPFPTYVAGKANTRLGDWALSNAFELPTGVLGGSVGEALA